MGVKAADLTTEAIQMYNMPAGAFITEVTEGGAADNAGIKKRRYHCEAGWTEGKWQG